jgi:hypothetical protein
MHSIVCFGGAKLRMDTEIKRQNLLKILLITSMISTFIHFGDNYVHFAHYPQPVWITPPSVYRSWIIWTVSAIVGYMLYQRRQFWLSYPCLTFYSFCGITSLGHYLYGSISEFSVKMHIFILTDGLAGFSVLGFTIWSSLILREQFKFSSRSI